MQYLQCWMLSSTPKNFWITPNYPIDLIYIKIYLLSSSNSCPPWPKCLVSISEDDFCLSTKMKCMTEWLNIIQTALWQHFMQSFAMCTFIECYNKCYEPYLRSSRLLGRHLGTASWQSGCTFILQSLHFKPCRVWPGKKVFWILLNMQCWTYMPSFR